MCNCKKKKLTVSDLKKEVDALKLKNKELETTVQKLELLKASTSNPLVFND